jgi:hypothetical protein
MIVEKQMECRLEWETEVLGENLPQRHFCPSQNTTWPEPDLNPAAAVGSRRLTAKSHRFIFSTYSSRAKINSWNSHKPKIFNDDMHNNYVRALISLWLFLFPVFLFAPQPKNCFLNGLKKSEQRSHLKCVELSGEYVELIHIFNPAACCFLYKAKHLSAPPPSHT